jgi:hypothetical protein
MAKNPRDRRLDAFLGMHKNHPAKIVTFVEKKTKNGRVHKKLLI